MLAVEERGETGYCFCVIPRGRIQNTAFTLVELVVVITIIGILAALFLAAIAQVKGKALRIQCANNVRQLGLALQEFVTDSHGYPLFISEHPGSWVAALQHSELSTTTNRVSSGKYLSQGVWKCPSVFRPNSFPTNRFFMSYGYNAYGMSAQTDTNSLGVGGHYVWDFPHNTRWPAPPVNENEIASPSEMMAIGDGFEGGNGIIRDAVSTLWRTYGLTDDLGGTKRSYGRHQGKANVVFCDGHVESPTLKFLFEDTSDAALSRWNRDHLPHRERLAP
jgi:prepilin-type processing-associated H-X9-DG protein/prepilin-type N-terminal cleavage/methylation domain-containing protein